jgi:hypothetical protein
VFLTQRCASGDVFLTQGLQGSAQGFAGTSGDVRAVMC